MNELFHGTTLDGLGIYWSGRRPGQIKSRRCAGGFGLEIKSAGLSWIKAAKIGRHKILLSFSLTDGANK